MAAERGGSAVADRLESLSLMSADYVAPLREELFFVFAEDIGHFEPMFCHRVGERAFVTRISSTEPSVSSGLLVERTALSER
jgi:hypothetical protein